jgi:hypothetical protein
MKGIGGVSSTGLCCQARLNMALLVRQVRAVHWPAHEHYLPRAFDGTEGLVLSPQSCEAVE